MSSSTLYLPGAPRALALAALLGAFAAPTAHAKEFNWTFDLPGGAAAQRFDGLGPLYDYFFTPVAHNADLWGEVRIDTLSIVAPGRAVSDNGGYFDTDVFFIPPFVGNALPGQRFNHVSITDLPTNGARWSYVIRSDSGGAQSFNADWDFRTEAGSASPFLHLVKRSNPGPLTTFSNGLRAQLRVWSAAAPTSIVIDSLKVTVTGRIVRYQILPAANDRLIDIEPGDDAFNEIEVFNAGTLRVRDTLTNRSSARLFNSGGIEIAEASARTELVNRGELQNLAGGSIVNSGRFSNESGARLFNLGSFDNRASFAGAASPDGPDFPTARDPGFFNAGSVDLDGGTFSNAEGRFFNTGTVNIGADGRFRNEGSFVNGTETSNGASFTSLGLVEHLSGSFVNYARINSSGIFRNLAELHNKGELVVAHGGTDSRFVNDGTLRNGRNFALSVFDRSDSGTLRVDGLLTNNGLIENRSSLDVNGELNNLGRLNNQGEFRDDPDVRLRVTGLVRNSGQFESTGQVEVVGGRFDNASTVSNGGTLAVSAGGVLSGGTVFNQGRMLLQAEGAMTDLLLYRQTGADALTQVNGRLQAQRVEITAGTLKGSNRVEAGEIVIGPEAVLAPGNSPGLLTIAGTLLMDGTLELEIAETGSDRLVVEGGILFGAGAVVRYTFLDGALPGAGQSFSFDDFVSASSGVVGLDGVSFQVAGLAGDSQVEWNGSGFAVTAVPEPQAWLLLAVGVGLLGVRSARRSRHMAADSGA